GFILLVGKHHVEGVGGHKTQFYAGGFIVVAAEFGVVGFGRRIGVGDSGNGIGEGHIGGVGGVVGKVLDVIVPLPLLVGDAKGKFVTHWNIEVNTAAGVVAAPGEGDGAGKLPEFRVVGVEQHRAGGGVAAKQGALGAFQNLDVPDIQQVDADTKGPGNVHPVDIDPH